MLKKYACALLCIAFFTLSGCMKNNLDKLNGTWNCDAKATLAPHEGTIDKFIKTSGLAASVLENVQFVFHAESKKVIRSFSGIAEVSSFTVVSDKGNELVLSIEGKKNTVVFTTADSISIKSEGDPLTMIFIKTKD